MKAKTEPVRTRLTMIAALLLVARSSIAAETYDKNLEKEFQLSPGGTLNLRADHGSIQVSNDGGDKVRVHVFRQVKHGTKGLADDLFANHEVTFSQDGNTVSVVAKSKDNKIWSRIRASLEVRFEVSIPRKFDVALSTAGGDIRVGDLDGEATARTSSGAIKLGKIAGAVETGNSGGDILIEEAGAKATARTSSGSIQIRKAAGKLEASNSGGDIRVETASQDVAVSTSSGKISLGTVNGSVDAKNSGGDIMVQSAGGTVTAQTSSGSIHLTAAKGKSVRLRNSGGEIEIGDAEGDVYAETSSGRIRIKSARGKVEARDSGGDVSIGNAGSVSARTSSGAIKVGVVREGVEVKNSGGDISIGEAGGEIFAQTSSGAIAMKAANSSVTAKNSGGRIRIDQAAGGVVATTSSGDINVNFSAEPRAGSRIEVSGGGIGVALPKGASLELDARSSGGKVLSDLPVSATVRKEGVLQGKINEGGHSLILRASSGDIHVREATPMTAEKETGR